MTKEHAVFPAALGAAILIGYMIDFGTGNFAVLALILWLVNHYWLRHVIRRFQENTWPRFQMRYRRFLTWCLHRPWQMMFSTLGLFILSIVFLTVRNGGVSFFPVADPNFVYVYTSLPVGTDQAYTDSVTRVLEEKVYKAIDWPNPMVKSVISNVTVAVTDPQDEDQEITRTRARSPSRLSSLENAMENRPEIILTRSGRPSKDFLVQKSPLPRNKAALRSENRSTLKSAATITRIS